MNQSPEEERQESLLAKKTKEVASKKGKAAIKKLGKKAAKAVAKASLKVGLALGKLLIGLLAGIGGPTLLIIGAVLLAIFIIYLAFTMIFANEPGLLEGEALELRNHIVAAADATVDMSRPEQVPYRVPHELIISAMQIYNSGEHGVSEKDASTLMAQTLKPIFTYKELEGKIESIQTTCVNGSCSSVTTFTPFKIKPLERVEAWDRIMEATFTPHITDWEQGATQVTTNTRSVEKLDANGKVIPNEFTVETDVTTVTTKTRSHTFLIDEVITEDYSHYDRMLATEPFSYGQQDRFLVEALYQATGGYINYTAWLTGNSLIGLDGTVIPGGGVPLEYMQFYLEAEKKYKVDWFYLAALHFIETGFSTHPTMISGVGAEGHMQFMPCTFIGWSYPGCAGTNGYVNVPDSIKTNPGVINKHGGYGVDANGDGRADPWDVKDAIFTAANYLSKSGFSKNIDSAIRNYNHSDKYVADVKSAATRFKDSASYTGNIGKVPELAPGSFMRPAVGSVSSKYGPRKLKDGFHYGTDIVNSIGTPIVAMADGTVIKYHSGCPQQGYLKSTCGGGWGNHIYVEHIVQGHKFVAVYAHFSKTVAPKGQKVKQGQIVGLMGASGSVTGPHLHVELHQGSYKRPQNVLNPGLYIPF